MTEELVKKIKELKKELKENEVSLVREIMREIKVEEKPVIVCKNILSPLGEEVSRILREEEEEIVERVFILSTEVLLYTRETLDGKLLRTLYAYNEKETLELFEEYPYRIFLYDLKEYLKKKGGYGNIIEILIEING